MKTFYVFLLIFFCACSSGYAEVSKRYDTLASDLSRNISAYSEISRPSGTRTDVAGRDPLQPLVDAQGNILGPAYVNTDLMVQGIVNSGTSPVALINDRFYSQGDTVGHDRLLEIRADGVIVQNEKGTTFVPLYPGSNKEN